MVQRNPAAVLMRSILGALLLAWLAAAPLAAQLCDGTLELKPENAEKAGGLWDTTRENGCFGSRACRSQICLHLEPLIQRVSDGTIGPDGPINALVESLRDPARKGEMYDKLRRRTGLFLENLQNTPPEGWNGKQFEVSPANRLFESEPADTIDFERQWKDRCGTPQACALAWREAADTATHSQLLARVVTASTNRDRTRMLTYLEGLEDRWMNYLTGSRSQYPWELLINGWRYRRTANLVEPPNNQFILLHPSAAFELSNRDGGNAAASLVLEAFGWNSWSWKANKTVQRFGASAIVSWRTTTALPGDRIAGYGGMFHLPLNLSMGYVYRPTDMGRHSFLMGADIGKIFMRGQKARKLILGGK